MIRDYWLSGPPIGQRGALLLALVAMCYFCALSTSEVFHEHGEAAPGADYAVSLQARIASAPLRSAR
jgi:hypothetical protein